ncbi:hypothetical protein Vadar_033920 [Vaccinium darrowii]|uniref:Uncharacterized protein n=1 Tax=Vaccinium darrowii TaxID=229202 RepID=A0ACB7X687_9ERIC|nr:hypothetical protein Vadar_033920 [Vaccinium darrowii]
MSYAEAVSCSKSKGPRRISIEANPSEWLRRSAVVKLRSLSAMEVISEALLREGDPKTEVFLGMGGPWVVLTFSSTDSMKALLEGGKLSGLNKWFEEVHQWSPELPIVSRRYVWISCYGISLHGWSVATFLKIAQLWIAANTWALEVGDRGPNNLNTVHGCLACVEDVGDKKLIVEIKLVWL